jgi:hypothetical protein
MWCSSLGRLPCELARAERHATMARGRRLPRRDPLALAVRMYQAQVHEELILNFFRYALEKQNGLEPDMVEDTDGIPWAVRKRLLP